MRTSRNLRAGLFPLLAASALAPLGCQISPHGERAALRATAVEPDPGDARTLASVLAQAESLGVAGTPVAHAPTAPR